MAEDIWYFSTRSWSGDEVALYRKYMKNAKSYNTGAFLCGKYLHGTINLDQFCAEMIEEDLKEELINIPSLPKDLVSKYELAANIDSNATNNGGLVDVAVPDDTNDVLTIPEIHSDIETNGYWVINDGVVGAAYDVDEEMEGGE